MAKASPLVLEVPPVGNDLQESTEAAPESGPMASRRIAVDADWPTLALLSRRYIERTMTRVGGNKTRAADLLGIDRRTLSRIMARDRVKRSTPQKPA